MPHTGVGTKVITFDYELFFLAGLKKGTYLLEKALQRLINNFFDVLMRRLFGVAFFFQNTIRNFICIQKR